MIHNPKYENSSILMQALLSLEPKLLNLLFVLYLAPHFVVTIPIPVPLDKMYRCAAPDQEAAGSCVGSPLDGGRDSTNVDLILWSLLMPTRLFRFLSHPPIPRPTLTLQCIQTKDHIAPSQPKRISAIYSSRYFTAKPHCNGVRVDYVTGDYGLK